jgi:hypothetical protein
MEIKRIKNKNLRFFIEFEFKFKNFEIINYFIKNVILFKL